MFRKIILSFCLFSFSLLAEESHRDAFKNSQEFDFAKGIHFDLESPKYVNGVVSTDSGGVVSGKEFRIQAMHIVCTKREAKNVDTPLLYEIEASGSLMVQFGEYLFIGEKIEYDFLSKTGVIYQGKIMAEPWFFGGDRIFLQADGSYFLENTYATTSESEIPDWAIVADSASLSTENILQAHNVKLKVFQLPVFWIPSLRINLDWIFDAPIKYDIKWGGKQGHRFGIAYDLFSWNNWRAAFLLEYRLKMGLGGGIESQYTSEDKKTTFQAINYAARDSSIIHTKQRFRYRFQGLGDSLLFDDKLSIHLSYDKVSDIDMPTDFDDRGLDLEVALRTELLIHQQDEDRISNLITHVRINNFQTIKEELPTFMTSWRPFEFGNTKIICNNSLKVSYLDFSYGNNQLNVRDYTSPRLELSPTFYRYFNLGYVNITPELGGLFIGYGNSQDGSAKWLTMGKGECLVDVKFWKNYGSYKHMIVPYLNYTYYTMPTVSPGSHYIFDIQDGWYRLNMLRFGFRQTLTSCTKKGWIQPLLNADIYANAFFDTHTFSQTIPKVYGQLTWNPFSYLRYILDTGWDFIHGQLDHYNARIEWTVSADLAASFEYRHRSAFDWRKADRNNFILDSYRTIAELRNSQLSDRRDTLLFHLFYRFHPSWALELESRHGWNRIREPSYNEFEIDLLGRLRSAMHFKLSYQHREDDDRISVYFSIGLDRPKFCKMF